MTPTRLIVGALALLALVVLATQGFGGGLSPQQERACAGIRADAAAVAEYGLVTEVEAIEMILALLPDEAHVRELCDL